MEYNISEQKKRTAFRTTMRGSISKRSIRFGTLFVRSKTVHFNFIFSHTHASSASSSIKRI